MLELIFYLSHFFSFSFIILRFLAMKITFILLRTEYSKNGESYIFSEINPFSRILLKKPIIIILYNLLMFFVFFITNIYTYNFYQQNADPLCLLGLYIIFYSSIFLFIGGILDFLYDFRLYHGVKRYK